MISRINIFSITFQRPDQHMINSCYQSSISLRTCFKERTASPPHRDTSHFQHCYTSPKSQVNFHHLISHESLTLRFSIWVRPVKKCMRNPILISHRLSTARVSKSCRRHCFDQYSICRESRSNNHFPTLVCYPKQAGY